MPARLVRTIAVLAAAGAGSCGSALQCRLPPGEFVFFGREVQLRASPADNADGPPPLGCAPAEISGRMIVSPRDVRFVFDDGLDVTCVPGDYRASGACGLYIDDCAYCRADTCGTLSFLLLEDGLVNGDVVIDQPRPGRRSTCETAYAFSAERSGR